MENNEVLKVPNGSLPVALATGGVIEAVSLMTQGGFLGLLVSGTVGVLAYKIGPSVVRAGSDMLPASTKDFLRRNVKGYLPGRLGRDEEEGTVEDTTEEEDELFALEHKENPLPFERLDMERIIQNIPFNSYRVYLGRSVLTEKHPARSVNVENTHLKLIGASQKGKSSMAGCILTQLITTNDQEHLLIAVLDLEDKTGRLFENDPHIAQFQMGDIDVKMHARNEDQVLEYLGYIYQLMRWRYTLSEEEVSQQPLLVVYIEEFLDLKKYFKLRTKTAKKEEKEQAEQEYAELIEYISKIARRGLKARIQLLLCAQVDYRDDDLVEALANVTAGMCFAVKPTAAQAAGFSQVEYLQKVYADNVVGQASAEFSGCKDIVLAPDFPLKQKLLELERKKKGNRSLRALPVREFRLNEDPEIEEEERYEQLPSKSEKQQDKRERIIQRGGQYRFEGHTQAEVAEKLGLTQWTIRPYWTAIEEEAERLREQSEDAM